MSDTTPPEWAMKAAESIVYDLCERPRPIYIDNAAREIAKHAPKVRMLKWQEFTTADPAAHWEKAKSVFGIDYDVKRSGMSEIYVMNGSMFKSVAEAKAAAQADFERRVRGCYE